MTRVALEDFKSILGKGELAVIERAVESLEKNIPAADTGAVAAEYARKNIMSQEDIASLSAQVHVTKNKKYFELCHQIADEREDLASQGFRSAGERNEMIYRESRFVDASTTVERLSALGSYLDGLGWRLKNALSVLERL